MSTASSASQVKISSAPYTTIDNHTHVANSSSNCKDIVIRQLKAVGMATLASGPCAVTGGLLLHNYFHYSFYPNEGYRKTDLCIAILCFLGAAIAAVRTYNVWVVDDNY
jgi:hypothetical protein